MRRVVLFMLSVIIALAVVPAYAHSGGTDGKGGHFDRSTGEYHYHHGYPAHNHPNGVCPYEEKNENTKPVTTSKPKSSETVKTTTVNKANNKVESRLSSDTVFAILGTGFIGLLVVLFIILTIADSKGREVMKTENELQSTNSDPARQIHDIDLSKFTDNSTIGDSVEDDCSMSSVVVHTLCLSALAYFFVYRVLDVYEFREMAIACFIVWAITLLFAFIKRRKMRRIIQAFYDERERNESKKQNETREVDQYKRECQTAKDKNEILNNKLYALSKEFSVAKNEYIEKIQEISYKYEVECGTSSSLREDLESAYAEIRDLKANRVHPDTIAELENKNSSLLKELALFQDAYFVQKYGIIPDNTTQVPYKYCPKCGLKNDDNERVCRECRHDFSEDTYTIRKTPAAVSFVHWMVDKYNTPFQKSRRISAKSVVIDYYDANTKTAYIKEDDSTQYMTTHRFCSCPEFQSRELPCKHMYALMIQDGVLSADDEENEWR